MKLNKFFFVIVSAVLTLSAVSIEAQDVPAAVKSISGKLQKYGSSTQIVSAVADQNAKNVSLDKIKEIDKKWTETSGTDAFMKSILDNKCSAYLKSLQKSDPYIVEAFATDNKGANVGMTNKTSDYWQGDEDKFTKCFNNGAGTVFYGKLSFDSSIQTYVIQVSVPVINKGSTIGTVTFGIDTAKLK